MTTPEPSPAPKTKTGPGCMARALTAAAVLLALVVLGLFVGLDAIASHQVQSVLAERKLNCPDLGLASSLIDRRITLNPMTCTHTGDDGKKITLQTIGPTTIDVHGLSLTQTSVHLGQLIITSDSQNVPKNTGASKKDAQKLIDAIKRPIKDTLLDISRMAQRPWPHLQIDQLTLQRGKDQLVASIEDIQLNNTQHLDIHIQTAALAMRDPNDKLLPKDEWIKAKDTAIIAKPNTLSMGTNLEFTQTVLVLKVKVPLKLKVTASNLHTNSPKWDFKARLR